MATLSRVHARATFAATEAQPSVEWCIYWHKIKSKRKVISKFDQFSIGNFYFAHTMERRFLNCERIRHFVSPIPKSYNDKIIEFPIFCHSIRSAGFLDFVSIYRNYVPKNTLRLVYLLICWKGEWKGEWHSKKKAAEEVSKLSLKFEEEWNGWMIWLLTRFWPIAHNLIGFP